MTSLHQVASRRGWYSYGSFSSPPPAPPGPALWTRQMQKSRGKCRDVRGRCRGAGRRWKCNQRQCGETQVLWTTETRICQQWGRDYLLATCSITKLQRSWLQMQLRVWLNCKRGVLWEDERLLLIFSSPAAEPPFRAGCPSGAVVSNLHSGTKGGSSCCPQGKTTTDSYLPRRNMGYMDVHMVIKSFCCFTNIRVVWFSWIHEPEASPPTRVQGSFSLALLTTWPRVSPISHSNHDGHVIGRVQCKRKIQGLLFKNY